MPKSKRKKGRYTPQARSAQSVNAGVPTVTGQATATASKAGAVAAKPAPGAHLGYVRTELKIIGAVTGLILVGIFVVYFLIR